ncbi:MAG TPA: YezD family protein [Verrucomicrobiales bacterium]|jgi:hypothetical protein|nr:YezD family protein [Verrucomicrobiales bacterium]
MSTTTDEITVESWLEVVRRKVSAIRFGSVQITVHEGRVTQVESLEKTRIAPDKNGNGESSAGHRVKSS